MEKRNHTAAAAAGIGMLMLILDGRTALAGMRDGVDICLRVLIPSLFPFFILSSLLITSLSGTRLPLLSSLGRLLSMPEGSEYLLVTGALGGYPVGAQSVAASFHAGQLSRADAVRMLAFCSNAGPSFIFGMLAPLFTNPWTPWLLWAVHLGSALFVGLSLPGEPAAAASPKKHRGITLPQALERSIRVMALVCGWVILFRLVLAFLDRWIFWALPGALQVLLSGLLELSNGCVRLASVPQESLRFFLAAVILSSGGSCVGLQTVSVCDSLPCRTYFFGKLLQTAYTVILTAGIFLHPLFVLLLFIPWILKKRGSNWAILGV